MGSTHCTSPQVWWHCQNMRRLQSDSEHCRKTWCVSITTHWRPVQQSCWWKNVHKAWPDTRIPATEAYRRVERSDHHQHFKRAVQIHSLTLWRFCSCSHFPAHDRLFAARHSSGSSFPVWHPHHRWHWWIAHSSPSWSFEATWLGKFPTEERQVWVHAPRSHVLRTSNHSRWLSADKRQNESCSGSTNTQECPRTDVFPGIS